MNLWMKRTPAGTVVAVFLVGLLAGCLGDDGLSLGKDIEFIDEPMVGLAVEHEVGSAHWGPDTKIQDTTWRSCSALGTSVGGLCREHAYPATGNVPPAGETDAAFDLRSTTFAENSTHLVVTLELGRLSEDWDHLEPGPRYWYSIDIEIGEIPGAIGLSLWKNNGMIMPVTGYYEWDEGCNDWWLCHTRMPVEFFYGEPGFIQFEVPRAIMLHAQKGDEIKVNGVNHGTNNYGAMLASWGVQAGPLEERGRVPVDENWAVIDWWRGEQSFTFNTPLAEVDVHSISSSSYDLIPGGGLSRDGDSYRSDLDMHRVEIHETETTFSLEIEFALVEEDPQDHSFWLAFGTEKGRVPQSGFDAMDGTRDLYSGYEDMAQDRRWIDMPVTLDVQPGSPGKLNFTWDRVDLGSPERGDRLTFIYLNSWERARETHTLGPLELDVRLWVGGDFEDWGGEGPPYWFLLDTTPQEEQLGLEVTGSTGGTQMPPTFPLDEVNEDQYDITSIQAHGHDEETAHMSLGVQDLSQVEVPRGYEAIVYAVAMQTDAGKFKAFYYKDHDHQDFYCAPDTLLLTDDPSDPRGTVWTRVTGMLSHSGRSPVAGDGPASGAISFQVPHECFGAESAKPFQVHELAGGTFILEEPLGVPELLEIHQVDVLHAPAADLPFLLGMESIARDVKPASAWYIAPLGLEGQDWNILGVVIAVLLAAGGAIAVWTKRRKLRNYLARVDQAAAIKDLAARETALAELRSLLRADLVAGQVSEGHYTVVMRHIDEAMKHVRVKSIEETFRELPFHIVSKLRSVLDDGVITQDEHEMVTDLIERAQIPTRDKQKVLSRLERWQLVDEVAKA